MRTSALLRSRGSEGVFEKPNRAWKVARFNIGGKSMTTHISPWLLRRKWILIVVGLPVLVALWWAFQPEKLWINQTVNEPAPFDTSSDPQTILTGRFEGDAQQTRGRATIYKKPGGGDYLRLNDFTTPNGRDLHVVLARRKDRNLSQAVVKGSIDSIDLGPLKSNQGDQIYDLPAATNLNQYNAVAIYGEVAHTVFGLAKLEAF
jgi:hypothetical protein